MGIGGLRKDWRASGEEELLDMKCRVRKQRKSDGEGGGVRGGCF